MAADKEKMFSMRQSDEERIRLDELSKHFDISNSSVVRMLVKEKYDALVKQGLLDDDGARPRKKRGST